MEHIYVYYIYIYKSTYIHQIFIQVQIVNSLIYPNMPLLMEMGPSWFRIQAVFPCCDRIAFPHRIIGFPVPTVQKPFVLMQSKLQYNKGTINRWFPLIRPYWGLISWGGWHWGGYLKFPWQYGHNWAIENNIATNPFIIELIGVERFWQ